MALGQYLVWRSQCTNCFLTFKAKKKVRTRAAAVTLELALMLGPCINANSSDHLTSAYVSSRSGAALNTSAPLTEF